jgi:hypothetical protein
LLAYFSAEHAGSTAVTGSALASLREALHLSPHASLSQYLSQQTKGRGSRRGHFVKTAGGYVLERAYSKSLQVDYLGRPASKNISASLRGTLSAIGDPSVRTYLDEAIGCFEHNLLRSAIVMTWCVGYGLFRAWLYRNHLAALNANFGTWKTPVHIVRLDDFQDLNEGTVIETARKLKLITKEQHKTLKQLLDQRNSYAHPTLKAITPSFSEAYIEAVLRDVIPHFG